MGRLTRWLAAAVLGIGLGLLGADATVAFDGFGSTSADSTYGEQITFEVELDGVQPDAVELLLRTPGGEGAFVVPVEPRGDAASYVWDTSSDYVTPNTLIRYQWRATDDGRVTLSEESTIRYEDDRPGLDWQSEQLGEATVHWYGDAETQARRFGELTALGVEQAEELLGTELAGPVDVFVYDTQEDFFGALGPGAREWIGAAAYSELRTIFMWLEGGSRDYLEVAMVHEVTHIVFHDATDNPYHEPARWINEGIASWSETGDAVQESAIVRREAAGEGLFAFEAISEQFPIGQRGGTLSYAMGATMIDFIIDRHGSEAIARLAAAYRDGASDAEALEAATGTPADELYLSFYSEFGVDPPTAIAPDPIQPSNVDRPTAGEVDPGGVDPDAEAPPGEASPGDDARERVEIEPWVVVTVAVVAVVLVAGAAVAVSRRADARGGQ